MFDFINFILQEEEQYIPSLHADLKIPLVIQITLKT
jgi:hypothetical protein